MFTLDGAQVAILAVHMTCTSAQYVSGLRCHLRKRIAHNRTQRHRSTQQAGLGLSLDGPGLCFICDALPCGPTPTRSEDRVTPPGPLDMYTEDPDLSATQWHQCNIAPHAPRCPLMSTPTNPDDAHQPHTSRWSPPPSPVIAGTESLDLNAPLTFPLTSTPHGATIGGSHGRYSTAEA